MGESLRPAPDSPARRGRGIDLELRLALRVAALAAICFIAVAAYALVDSDRATRAKLGHIADIVAKDISLQQAQARWFSRSSDVALDLQRLATLLEPGLCIADWDNAGRLHRGLWGRPVPRRQAPRHRFD